MIKHEDNTAPPVKRPAGKTVEINISLPAFSALEKIKTLPFYRHVKRGWHLAQQRPALVGGVACALFIAGYGIFSHNTRSAVTSPATNTVQGLQRGTPDYRTLLPRDKSADSLGGWVRVSPSDRNPVYAYVDQIGPTSISVSQQPLPDNFTKDTAAQIEQLAKSYAAAETIDVGGIPVYIGTSSNGPQSVIFTKDKLLILIKSTARIENDQWHTYIASLR